MQGDSTRQPIFVYGTLMRGSCRHHVIAEQEFLGEAKTERCYRLYNLGTYPGLVETAIHGYAVQGELYNVTCECLKELDEIEAVGSSLYERKRIQLLAPWKEIVSEAYFYLGDLSTCTDIGSRWSVDLEC